MEPRKFLLRDGDDVINPRMLSAFLSNNGDPNGCPAYWSGATKLMARSASRFIPNPQVSSSPPKKEANGKNRFTPLHIAALSGSIESIQLLLEQGARLDSKDFNGRTPLDVAIAQGHSEQVIQLLSSFTTTPRNDENHSFVLNQQVKNNEDPTNFITFADFLPSEMDKRVLRDISKFIQMHPDLQPMAKYHTELTEELFGFACLVVFHMASNTNYNRQHHHFISPTRTLRKVIELLVDTDYELLNRLEELAMRFESSLTPIRPSLWSVIQQEQVLIELLKGKDDEIFNIQMGIHDEEIQASFALSIDVLNARLNRTLPEDLDNLSVDDISNWQANESEKDAITHSVPLYRRIFRDYTHTNNTVPVAYDDDDKEQTEDNYIFVVDNEDVPSQREAGDDDNPCADYERPTYVSNDDQYDVGGIYSHVPSPPLWTPSDAHGQEEYDPQPVRHVHYHSNDNVATVGVDDYDYSDADYRDGQFNFDNQRDGIPVPTTDSNVVYAQGEEDDGCAEQEEQQMYTAAPPPLLMVPWKLIFQFYELYRPNLLSVVREQQYRPQALGRMCQTMRETFETEWSEFVGGNVQLMFNDLYGQYQHLSRLVRELDEHTRTQDKHKLKGEIFGCIHLLYDVGASEESAQDGEQTELDELLIQFHALAKILNDQIE